MTRAIWPINGSVTACYASITSAGLKCFKSDQIQRCTHVSKENMVWGPTSLKEASKPIICPSWAEIGGTCTTNNVSATFLCCTFHRNTQKEDMCYGWAPRQRNKHFKRSPCWRRQNFQKIGKYWARWKPPYEPQLCSNDDFWDTVKQYEHNHGSPASSDAQLKPRVWQVTQSSDKEVPPKLKRGVAERVRKATCQECGASWAEHVCYRAS